MPRFVLILTSLFILVFLVGASLAGIPKLINYQGMLTDNSGNPLTGSYNITFKIWTDTTGGSSLWDETHAVQVQNGLYNVILGQMTALNLPFDQQYWLEVIVGDETMPRIRFTSVGYAYRAMIADSAVVAVSAPTGGGWTDEGTKVRLTSSSDSVGIGTTNPQAKLHISGGNIRLDYGSDIRMVQGNGYSSDILKFGNDLQFCNFATGYIDFRTNTSPSIATARLHINNDGNVGIGTISPHSTLHDNGSFAVAYRLVSGSYTATASDCIIATNGGSDAYITLPSAVGIAGRVYTIKQVVGGIDTWVYTTGSQTIDGASNYNVPSAYNWVTVVSNGANWYVIGKNP